MRALLAGASAVVIATVLAGPGWTSGRIEGQLSTDGTVRLNHRQGD